MISQIFWSWYEYRNIIKVIQSFLDFEKINSNSLIGMSFQKKICKNYPRGNLQNDS